MEQNSIRDEWIRYPARDGGAFFMRRIPGPWRQFEAIWLQPVNDAYFQYNRVSADLDDWIGTRAGRLYLDEIARMTRKEDDPLPQDENQLALMILEWLANRASDSVHYLNHDDARRLAGRVLGRTLEEIFGRAKSHTKRKGAACP